MKFINPTRPKHSESLNINTMIDKHLIRDTIQFDFVNFSTKAPLFIAHERSVIVKQQEIDDKLEIIDK